MMTFPAAGEVSHEARILLAKERINKSFSNRKKTQRSISKEQFNVGDLVLLRVPSQSSKINQHIGKFFHLYRGPHIVLKTFENNSYKLGHSGNSEPLKGSFNKSSLKRYNQQ